MFVAVACDPGSEDHRESIRRVLQQYGLKRIQEDLYESVTLRPDALPGLKKELDQASDGYDELRIFQYPMEGGLVISSLKDKKWRKIIVSSSGAGS
jgi:CRISPR-associated protein Cas2